MAIKKCTECKHEVSDKAESCPHCGAPIKKSIWTRQYGCGSLLLVLLALGFIGAMLGEQDNERTRASSGTSSSSIADNSSSQSGSGTSTASKGILRYAHKTINIRSGPGTDNSVVGQLTRGDSIWVQRDGDKWRKIVRGSEKGNYIYVPLLEQSPLPAVEIASWNWIKDPSFGVDGAIVWNAEVRNNTTRYIDAVKLEITTYDAAGSIVTTDASYAKGLSPGGTASTKGYATYYGKEQKARLQIKGIR